MNYIQTGFDETKFLVFNADNDGDDHLPYGTTKIISLWQHFGNKNSVNHKNDIPYHTK